MAWPISWYATALLTSRYDGVADLVVRDDLLLVVGQTGGLALLAGDDPLDALLEVLLARTLATEADGAKGALVNDICQIGTGGTGCGAGDRCQVDAGFGLHILGMKLEDGLTTGQVRQLDGHAAVAATRTQQCGVERVGTVGGRKDDDALLVVVGVHLGEELVERRLGLVVSRETTTVTLLADGFDLIDEDDAGGLFLGSDKTVDLRCWPAMTTSTLSSKSSWVARLRPRRTARRAPSLMILAKSAPEAPGVARAIVVKSMPGSVFTSLE